ncbi:TRAP transporter permease [Leisingera thetidis]|uniref:TRAP transporter permease n=1 Tax=Leisingera thetidis TaxID=2930199 RepID=UPI0021F6E82D|nr:TRAP transporter fused permease subunit [Leisingera thetidis]
MTVLDEGGQFNERRITVWLGLVLVLLVMVNNLPNIPGLLDLVRSIPGFADIQQISKFDPSVFFPMVFFLMMIIALTVSSFSSSWRLESRPKFYLGVFLDTLMFVTTVALCLVYWIEHPDICLIDQLNGERARLMAENLARAEEYRELFGTDPVADMPECVTTLGNWILPFFLVCTAVFFLFIIKMWGFPIVVVALLALAYTVITSLIWYFGLSDNPYLTTAIGSAIEEERSYSTAIAAARNAIILESNGVLGQFLNIIVNTVFPYIVLGALFGASAGGQSLIRMAVAATYRLRGGSAHAAIVGSAAFGTISGGPVVNVLGTGTLTIPMMQKAGYSGRFAGGVEAAASTGGQIMPPVMGVAAFVLASLSGVPYSEVIVAAFLPAVAYFLSMFLTVMFQARKSGIEAIGELTEDQKINRQDLLNLVMIFVPILIILFLLLTGKDEVSTGFLARLIGYDAASGAPMPWILELIRNGAGDPDSTGFWAVVVLFGLLFLDPGVRAVPAKLLDALSQAGILAARMYLLLIAVTVIDICNNFTNFTGLLTIDVLNWLKTADVFQVFGLEVHMGGSAYLMLVLVVAMCVTILLGMGMPTLPAYVNVILLVGPLLVALGTSVFTAHLFVFYFAVASAITPPVAIAAYAASTISKSEPMATGIAAVRAGIVVFTIPFVFAFYPEILLIDYAQLAPGTGSETGSVYLDGYDGTIDTLSLVWLLLRLVLALYLVSSALAGFERAKLARWEIWLRLAVAGAVLFKTHEIQIAALILAGLALAWHWRQAGKTSNTGQNRWEAP